MTPAKSSNPSGTAVPIKPPVQDKPPAVETTPAPKPKLTEPPPNHWTVELSKFKGQEVQVEDTNGCEFSGMCVAINYQHCNVVLRTETEKIIIRNLAIMRRKCGPDTVKPQSANAEKLQPVSTVDGSANAS